MYVRERGRVCLLKQKGWEWRWSAVSWMETIYHRFVRYRQTGTVSVPRHDHGSKAHGYSKRPSPVATAAEHHSSGSTRSNWWELIPEWSTGFLIKLVKATTNCKTFVKLSQKRQDLVHHTNRLTFENSE